MPLFFHPRIAVWESDDTLCLVLHKFRVTSFHASRREPWEQGWSFGSTSIKNDNLNNYGLSNKFFFISFLSSKFYTSRDNCCFSPDDSQLLVSKGRNLVTFNVENGKEVDRYKNIYGYETGRACFSPQGKAATSYPDPLVFSFPSFLALHHQSPACNSRFTLASVRKMKRLRPRRQIRLRLFNMTTYQWERSSWVLNWSKTFSLSRHELAIVSLLQHMFALNSACNRGSTHCGPIFTQDNWQYRA